MTKLRAYFALAFVSLLLACGGKVAVDQGSGMGAGTGLGGLGAGGTGAVPVGGEGGQSCFNPPDPASLSFCGGSSSGGGAFCIENDFCDNMGNIWTARCSATGCQCLLNTVLQCDCSGTGNINYCSGTPTCCPGIAN